MYLVDTNIIIYYLEGERAAVSFLSEHRGKMAISCITWMETLSYPFSKAEEQIVRTFLQEFILLEIAAPVMELVVGLRRKKKIKLPDAIIAASAIHNGLILVTRNTKDFKGTATKIIDPFVVTRLEPPDTPSDCVGNPLSIEDMDRAIDAEGGKRQ